MCVCVRMRVEQVDIGHIHSRNVEAIYLTKSPLSIDLTVAAILNFKMVTTAGKQDLYAFS